MANAIHRSPWVVAVVLLCAASALVTSCAADSRAVGKTGQPLGSGGALALPDPAGLAARITSAETRLRLGSEFDDVLLQPCRVAMDGADAVFDPNWDHGGTINQTAYALYTFNVPETAGALPLMLRWNGAPDADELWIAAANFTRGTWDWYTFTAVPPAIALTAIPNAPQHRTTEGDVLIVVLTIGHSIRKLELLEMGAAAPQITDISPRSGQPDEVINLSAVVSGSDPLTYAWDFGGGATPNTSSDVAPSITLGAYGTYQASLTVTNPLGEDTFDFQLGVGIPVVTGITPRVGYRGQATAFSATVVASGAYTLTWYMGGISAAGEVTELNPTVTLTALGNKLLTVRASNANGGANYSFPFTILPDPATLPVDSLIAMPLDPVVAQPNSAQVVVMMGATTHPFQFMDGVAVRVETASSFVSRSLDIGIPDDTPDYVEGGNNPLPIDGFWAAMNPPAFILPPDDLIHTYDLEDGTEYTLFNITPLGGSDLIGGSGALFVFSLAFNEPGTYHLQLLQHDPISDTDVTKYSDSIGNIFFWSDISNSVLDLPNSIEVITP